VFVSHKSIKNKEDLSQRHRRRASHRGTEAQGKTMKKISHGVVSRGKREKITNNNSVKLLLTQCNSVVKFFIPHLLTLVDFLR